MLHAPTARTDRAEEGLARGAVVGLQSAQQQCELRGVVLYLAVDEAKALQHRAGRAPLGRTLPERGDVAQRGVEGGDGAAARTEQVQCGGACATGRAECGALPRVQHSAEALGLE